MIAMFGFLKNPWIADWWRWEEIFSARAQVNNHATPYFPLVINQS